MKNNLLLLFAILSLFSACIGDDFIDDEIDERLVVNNIIDSLQVGSTFLFETTFFNNVGQIEQRTINWMSTNEDVLSINENGLATALAAGNTSLIANTVLDDNSTLEVDFPLVVTEEEVVIEEPEFEERSGVIQTTTFYTLEGDFVLREETDQLVLEIAENYQASSSLPGLYIYLTNNPNTTNGALEIGRVNIFSGAHSYIIPDVDINAYSHILYFCKPFNVKVGDGEIQ